MSRNPNWSRDELILALDLYIRADGPHLQAHHPEVVRLSELLNALPLHDASSRTASFRNPNGVTMKFGNFMSIDPRHPGPGLARGSGLERTIWEEFANDPYMLRRTADAIRATATQRVAERRASYSVDDDDEEFSEGRILTRLHKEKERSRAAVERKKHRVLQDTGHLRCEACDFDFLEVYGELGRDYAECHHRMPLTDLIANNPTRLSDLAIVCANCHRMLHKSRPILKVEELRTIVQRNRTGLPRA